MLTGKFMFAEEASIIATMPTERLTRIENAEVIPRNAISACMCRVPS